jgi:hypothetical protein
MEFVPESITITRRADGHYDMVAVADVGTAKVQLDAILDTAAFTFVGQYSPRVDHVGVGICSSTPPRISSYDLTLQSGVRPNAEGIYYRSMVLSSHSLCDEA